MRSINGLLLGGGVPPGIKQDAIIGSSQIEPKSSCFQTDKKNRNICLFIKSLYELSTFLGLCRKQFVTASVTLHKPLR
jgi:hypothetical protein